MGRLTRASFSTIFYALTICGLVLGVGLVLAYSLYRTIALYCLFNIILFWITTPRRKGSSHEVLRISGRILTCLAVSAGALLLVLVVGTAGSLYTHPAFVQPMIVVKLILERSGLIAGTDFGLAHSPERVDPGGSYSNLKSIAKVVGGITPLCTEIAAELYAGVLQAQVVPVSDARTAEATKMLENTYRYVNIALANELAILHEKLGIDFFEVIAAALLKIIFHCRATCLIHDVNCYNEISRGTFFSKVFNMLYVHCLPIMDHILVVSQSLKDDLLRFYPHNDKVLTIWG